MKFWKINLKIGFFEIYLKIEVRKIKFKKIGILKNYLKMEVLKLFENWKYERYLIMKVLKLFENSNMKGI